MKSLLHAVVILIAAGLGLSIGLAYRARQASGQAAPSLTTSNAAALPRKLNVPASILPRRSPVGDDSPLAAQLEQDVAHSSGVARWLHWLVAVEKARPSDFPRLVRLARSSPAAMQFVVARWAEIAPRHCFDTVLASAADGPDFPAAEVAHILFSEWPKRDPEAAIAALNEPGTTARRWDWQHDVATTVIRSDIERGLRLFAEWHIENYMPFADERGPVPQWAAANPRHAAEFTLQNGSAAYLAKGVMKVVGEEWAKSEPAAALDFSATAGGQLGLTLGTAALKTWAERDLDQAAKWLAEADDSARNRLSPAFVEAWAKKDAAGALAWCNDNLSGSGLSRAVAAMVTGAGVQQVEAAASLIAGMEPSPTRAEGAAAVARQWFPSLGGSEGPSGAHTVEPRTAAWLASLDPLSIQRVLDQETWSWATSDPTSMAQFLLTLTNQAAGSWPDLCLARQMARRNPADALEWAARLPEGRGLAAGGEAYAEWRSAQPEAAAQWLNSLPPGDSRRERFFESAIRQIAYQPQAAEQLAAMTTLEQASARRIIESITSLPADQRARLIAGLPR